jgi:hypothetical protein
MVHLIVHLVPQIEALGPMYFHAFHVNIEWLYVKLCSSGGFHDRGVHYIRGH